MIRNISSDSFLVLDEVARPQVIFESNCTILFLDLKNVASLPINKRGIVTKN